MARKRITFLGAVAVVGLVASPLLAFLSWRGRGEPFIPNLALFLGGAALGWFIVFGFFRWAHRPLVAWALALIGLALGLVPLVVVARLFGFSPPLSSVARYLYDGLFTYGLAFGALVAWFPHCWLAVGIKPERDAGSVA